MTNDKTRQEAAPAADPIRQETGGQEPPAADQASTKPVKKRGRPKKKKIIVVEGSKDQPTAASLLTEDQAAAEGQEPTNWQDMTPHEFIEYARDNPEAARQDIQDYFSAGEGKEAADNLIAAARAMQGITKTLNSARDKATETSVKIVARHLKELNFNISNIINAIARVNELGALPEGADEDALDRFYDEWDALEPFVNAILAADPARKGMNAEQLLNTIPLWAVYHVDNMDGIDEKAQDAQEAANIKAVIEIIQRARDLKNKRESIFERAERESKKYLPVYQGNMLHGLMRLSARDFVVNGNQAVYEDKKGKRYTISNIRGAYFNLGVSAKKILTAGLIALTDQNYYMGNNINPTVIIPFDGYAELCERDISTQNRKKEFKKQIHDDLNLIADTKYTAQETKGKTAGNYVNMGIISSHSIRDGIIRINFDIDAARYFVKSYPAQFPKALFKISNRRHNSFAIGEKIAIHAGMDSNVKMGTNCTLSVEKLLEAAPEITTIKELKDRNQRNWKDKIKGPLETALNDFIDCGFFTRWEYRNPKTDATFTQAEAAALTWAEYSKLVVDWQLEPDYPAQAERRERKEAAARQAKQAAGATKKKRGRPKKEPANTPN